VVDVVNVPGTVDVLVDVLVEVMVDGVVDVLVEDSMAVVLPDEASSSPHATRAMANTTSAATRIAPTVASRAAVIGSGDAAGRCSKQAGQGAVVAG
jgi:hypothetical protein